jgi:hypothetical protein
MRLLTRLQKAGELLVLHHPGWGDLYVVRTGASREALAAAPSPPHEERPQEAR